MSSKDRRLVTIGVPIYNEERFLSRTLRSIAAIDYPNLEILIADNASTDRTEEICRDFAARDPRVRYLRRSEDIGPESNFYDVAAIARGDYFMWSGGHDLWHPTSVARFAEVLDRDDSVVTVNSHTVMIDADDVELPDTLDRYDTRGLPPGRRFSRVIHALYYCDAVHSLMRRDALVRVIRRQARPPLDHVLLGALALEGASAQLPEKLFLLRSFRQADVEAYVRARMYRLGVMMNVPLDLPPATGVFYAVRQQYLALALEAPISPLERLVLVADILACFRERWGVAPLALYPLENRRRRVLDGIRQLMGPRPHSER